MRLSAMCLCSLALTSASSAFWKPGDLVATQLSRDGVPARVVRANLSDGSVDVLAEVGTQRVDRVVATPNRSIYFTTGSGFSTTLRRIDPASGAVSIVASGGFLAGTGTALGMTALSDSKVLVARGFDIVEVDTTSGEQRLVARTDTVPNGGGFGGVTRADADHVYFSYQLFFPSDPDPFQSFVGRMNVHNGNWTVVSDRGLLDFTLGLTVDSSGFIVAADQAAQLLRIDPRTGAQFLIGEDFSLEGVYSVVEESPNVFLSGGFFTTRTDLNSFPRHSQAHPATLRDITFVPIPAPGAAWLLATTALVVARRRRV